MTNLGITVVAKKGAEAGYAQCGFLDGFVFDVSGEANKEQFETVKVADYRTAVGAASAMGNNGYFSGAGLSGVAVTLDEHLISPVNFTIVDDATTDPSVFEGLGEAVGKSIGRGIVKSALADFSNTSATSGEYADIVSLSAGDKTGFCSLYGECLAADIEPSESVLLLNGVSFSKLLAAGVADASVAGNGDAIKSADFPNGILGFGRVTGTNLLPSGIDGVIAHKTAVKVAVRPLPSDGSNDSYAVAKDDNGFAFDIKKIVDPKTGKRYVVGEALVGVETDRSKAIIVDIA